jgi:hypothetical protein
MRAWLTAVAAAGLIGAASGAGGVAAQGYPGPSITVPAPTAPQAPTAAQAPMAAQTSTAAQTATSTQSPPQVCIMTDPPRCFDGPPGPSAGSLLPGTGPGFAGALGWPVGGSAVSLLSPTTAWWLPTGVGGYPPTGAWNPYYWGAGLASGLGAPTWSYPNVGWPANAFPGVGFPSLGVAGLGAPGLGLPGAGWGLPTLPTTPVTPPSSGQVCPLIYPPPPGC